MTDVRTSQTGLQQSCVNWFRHHTQVRVQPPLRFIYSLPKQLLMQKATANLGICITIKQPYFCTAFLLCCGYRSSSYVNIFWT